MSSQPPAGITPQIKLINDWHDALSARNIEPVAKCMHKDFRRSVYPRNLGLPEQNGEDALNELSALLDFVTGIDVGHISCTSNLLHPG